MTFLMGMSSTLNGSKEMKRTRLFFLLLAGVLLLAGCQKEGKVGGKDAIRFAAASTPGTKTAYSGVETDGVERIDWVGMVGTEVGDVIRIYSDVAEHRYNQGQHWADYVIKDVTTSGAKSEGKIDNVPGDGTGNGLVWDEPGDYEFYAVYPNLASENGASGVLSASIPQSQSINMSGSIHTPDMSYAVMTAFQKVTTTQSGEGGVVNLDFTPAFTAFEFSFDSDITLDIQSFSLQSATTGTPIAGKYVVKFENGQPVYDCSEATGRVVDATFSARTQVSPGTPTKFTVFALPQDLKGLSIVFTVKAPDWDAAETRTLKLNYKDGSPVEFGACLKHKISGTMQGSGTFRYITLTGEVLKWEAVPVKTDSDNSPQTTQFSVSGEGVYNLYDKYGEDYKSQRQTWVLGANTAKVSFKLFSPLEGTYEVIPYVLLPDGTESTDISAYFTVTPAEGSSLSGTIGVETPDHHSHTATRVTFTIQALQAGAQLFFKTYATDKEGTATFSLDSETQLYDLRGYHYFRYDDPTL